LACRYDPLAGNVEVLGMAGDLKSEQKDGKKDLKPGHRLTLDSSVLRNGQSAIVSLAWIMISPPHKGASSITNICSKTGFSPRSSCRSLSGDK